MILLAALPTKAQSTKRNEKIFCAFLAQIKLMDVYWTCGEKEIPLYVIDSFGVPYGNRTRVAAAKQKQHNVIQGNFGGMDNNEIFDDQNIEVALQESRPRPKS